MQNERYRQRKIFGQSKGGAESGLGAIPRCAGSHMWNHNILHGLVIDLEEAWNMSEPGKPPDPIFPDGDQAYEDRHRPKNHAPALDLSGAAKHIDPCEENSRPASLRDDESLPGICDVVRE